MKEHVSNFTRGELERRLERQRHECDFWQAKFWRAKEHQRALFLAGIVVGGSLALATVAIGHDLIKWGVAWVS
jgi:hypothetical protein